MGVDCAASAAGPAGGEAPAEPRGHQRHHPRPAGRLPLARLPAVYGPRTTIYNRFNRWSRRGIWQALLARLVVFDAAEQQSSDSTTAKTHRCAAGGKGGPNIRPSAAAGAAGPPRSMPSPTAAGG